MRRRWIFGIACALALVAAFGCRDTDNPASVGTEEQGIQKPPPGGGGPHEIAFTEGVRKMGYCVRAMAVDGSNVASITCVGAGYPVPMFPSWEPAGTAIAYTTGFGLWRVNVDGTNTVQLLTEEQCPLCSDAAWSPQGDEIAVLGKRSGPTFQVQVLLLPATGCPWPNSSEPCPRVLYSFESTTGGYPGLAWSPDGTQLAMIAFRASQARFITLVDRATGAATDFFSWEAATRLEDWGRGEKASTLAIAATGGMYFYDLSTPQVPPQLVVPDGWQASFSPDGRYIVSVEFTGPHAFIFKRELATGIRTELGRAGTGFTRPDWRKPGT